MDGIVKTSAYIVWNRPEGTGDNECMNQNQKCIISIVCMDFVYGTVLMNGYMV